MRPEPVVVRIGHKADALRDFPSTLSAEARKKRGGLKFPTLGVAAAEWIEENFVIGGGEHVNELMRLLPWQRRLLVELLRVEETGRRKGLLYYRNALVGVAKKNGKSALAAAVALWMAAGSGQKSPHAVVAASSEDQAGIVYRAVRKAVEGGPLRPFADISANSVELRLAGGEEAIIQRVAAGVGTLDGLDLSFVVLDELHWWLLDRHRESAAILSQSSAARKESMVLAITTAGEPGENLCYERYERHQAVVSGEIEAGKWYSCWFEAPLDLPYDSPEAWRAAAPSMPELVSEEYLEEEIIPMNAESWVRRFYLNQWVESDDTWEGAARWEELAAEGEFSLNPGLPVWCGLDLSLSRDASAVVAVQFDPDANDGEGHWFVLPKIWENPHPPKSQEYADFVMPRDEILDYILFLKDAYPLPAVQEEERQGGRRYDGIGVAYDPYSANEMARRLEEAGVCMVRWEQRPNVMGMAAQVLEEAIMSGRLTHDGDSVMHEHLRNVRRKETRDGKRWMMVRRTGADRSKTHIDGPIACAMAVHFAMVQIANGVLEPERSARPSMAFA